MRHSIRLALGTALLADDTHVLWRFGLHQGRFFAVASVLITLSSIAMICAKGVA